MSAPLYVHLPGGGTLPAIGPAPFIALLIAESIVLEEWRDKICADLVRGGCRSFVAWGQDCGAWCVAMGKGSDGADLVMIAAHEDEPLAEAMWAAVHETDHPHVTLQSLAIIHVTPHARRDEILFQFQSAALREKPGI